MPESANSLQPHEYELTQLRVGRLDVYRATRIETIYFLDFNAVSVGTGEMEEIKKGDVGVSVGANPCITYRSI